MMVAGFEEEIAVLSKWRHPNLVVLMGWAREGKPPKNRDRCFLIYEFLSGGDVFQRLVKSKNHDEPFYWKERLAVARDAATGLAYLHNTTPHAFHRDVKSANILLGGGCAKMADFGLSVVASQKQKDKDSQMCKFPSGTPGYTCPTYIRTGKVTEGSEVYSFGMVLLEMLLNMMPAGMINGELVYPITETIRPSEHGALDRCIEERDREARWPREVASDVGQLALGCIHPDDVQRPRFNEVCRTLRGIQDRYRDGDMELARIPSGEAVPFVPRQPYVPPVAETPSNSPSFDPSAASSAPPQNSQDLASWAQNMSPATPGLAAAQAGGRPLGPERVRQAEPGRPPVPIGRTGSPVGRLVQQGSRSPSPPTGADDESISPPKRATAAAREAAAARAGVRRQTEAWPAGADVGLEVTLVHGKDATSLPSNVRAPAFAPSVDENGRKTLLLGRHPNQQWFEALLDDAAHRNSVSRQACEICWGGQDSSGHPMLRTMGSNLLIIDGNIVAKDQTAALSPNSEIRFMFQIGSELEELLTLVVLPRTQSNTTTQSIRGTVPIRAESPPVPGQGGYVRNTTQPELSRDNSAVSEADPVSVVQPAGKEEVWQLELVFAAGLDPGNIVALPITTRFFSFTLSPSRPSVVVGRQHQMSMFEALLQNHKELLAFVSRSHLQLELAGEGELQVTNLSQNISIACRTNILLRGVGTKMGNGDVISFAAQAEKVPGAESTQIRTGDGVDRELAPFLTFRLVKCQKLVFE